MTPDILSWTIAVLTIVFLSACAWSNKRNGYSRSLRKSGWKEWDSVVSHNRRSGDPKPSSVPSGLYVTPGPLRPERLVYSQRIDTGAQLVALNEALNSVVKCDIGPREAHATEGSANRPLLVERRSGESRQDSDRDNETPGKTRIRGSLLKNALGSFPTAFLSVLAATILGQGTVLWTGSAPMSLFVTAVIISAARGITTGVLATALSVAVMLSLFRGHISISNATENIVGLFVLIGVVTNLVFLKLHLRNRALAAARAELETVNQRLMDQARSLAEANSMLAEQKTVLFQAHHQLRVLSKQLANSMHDPLRSILETTERLVESNVTEFDAGLSQTSGDLIKAEVRRLDMLVEDLEHAC